MSANPVFSLQQWSDSDLAERVVSLALAGETDSFEWHCLDQEVQNRLANDYADREASPVPAARFRPTLVAEQA